MLGGYHPRYPAPPVTEEEEWAMTTSLFPHTAPIPLEPHPPHHPLGYPSQHLPPSLLETPEFSHTATSSLHSSPETAVTPQLPSYHLPTAVLQSPPAPNVSSKRPYIPDEPSPKQQSHLGQKRRKSTTKESWTMSEDDNLLLKLKDEEGLPWKGIALRFREVGRGEFRVPTLQMRYKRLKEKMRVWDAEDLQYLREAKEWLEKQKWEMISQKMMEFGSKKKIPGSSCEKKWKDIAPENGKTTRQTSPVREEDADGEYEEGLVETPTKEEDEEI